MDKLPLNNPLCIGDKVTFDGIYKRRTFWQWLRNDSRQIQQFRIVATNAAYAEYEETNG